MLQVAVGHSQDTIASLAAREVIEQCRQQLGDITPQAGVLVAAIDFEHERALEEITEAFPGISLIGCTTDGELSSRLGFQEDSLALLVLASDTITFCAGLGEQLSEDPKAAAKQAVATAKMGCVKNPSLCLMTPASLTASSTEVLAAVQSVLGKSFPIFGGIAGDQWKFEGTYQFFGKRRLRDSLPLLLFGGPIRFSHGVASGWMPLGKKGIVTRAEGNVLYAINERPAYDFFHYYVGANAIPSGEYPLAILAPGEDQPLFMRAPMAHDPDAGTVTFAGDIPEGAVVQITNANRQSILEASERSALQAMDRYPGQQPELAILISCAARKLFLGTRTSEEADILAKNAPDMPFFGFYAYGEFGAPAPNMPAEFHNETLITLLLGDG